MPSRDTLLTEGARIIRFGIVGVANTAIYTGIYLVLVAIGLPYLAASILGFAISISIAYFLNHRFTFRVAQHSRRVVVQFFLVQGIGAAINVVALAAAVEWLDWSPTTGQLVIIPPVVATTFIVNRVLVFRAHVDTRVT